jgi:Uma2 family endonuclease
LDRAAEARSEFLAGEMFAMSGAAMQHGRLQRNLITQLTVSLGGGPCEAFGSDFRMRVSGRMYAYPDVLVVCGKPALADEHQDVVLNPVVIFEVLSPSTETYDRGLKFLHYRSIEFLREYILVNQNQVLVEQYTRQADNT